jgi:transcription elongation GreA/GreB family factor
MSTPAIDAQRLDDPPGSPEAATVELTLPSGVGSAVEVEDLTTGLRHTYRLVEPHEAAPKDGLLSIESPVGKVLRSRRPREVVTATTPRGHRRLRIISVT